MSIGVALSPTPAGQAALARAVVESRLRDQALVVLHVVDTTEHAEQAEALAQARERIAAAVDAAGGADVSWDVATAATRGNVADALLDLAERAGVEMIVLGSRRRSPVGKLVMGSTVQRVLLDAGVPVMVVKE